MTTIIATGMCRTGTTCFSVFYNQLTPDIKSYHQKLNPGPKRNKRFDIDNPPKWALDYIDMKSQAIEESGFGLESNWELRHYMFNIDERVDGLKWLILIREINRTISSLKAYNEPGSKIDDLAELYCDTYESILAQVNKMPGDSWVRWIDSNKMFKGGYIGTMLKLVGVRNDMSITQKAVDFLKYPTRAAPKNYPLFEARLHMIDRAKTVIEKLKNVVREFGD